MPLITVLMPVHNGEKYLEETIDSVLCQTCNDFELLIVDDGSVDSTPAIIRSYSDSRIRYIRSDQRLKLAGALNLGISKAKGQFVARIDADDLCRKDRLEKQVSYMRKHKDLVLCGSAVELFGSGVAGGMVYPVGHSNIQAYLLFDNPFAHPSVMWRQQLFIETRLQYNVEYYPAEDYALWAKLVMNNKCDNLAQPLLRYRIHQASMTRADSANMDVQSMRIQQELLRDLGIDPTEEELLLHRYGCTNRLYPQRDSSALGELGKWFCKLQKCNAKTVLYNRYSFGHCLSKFWYAACYHALRDVPSVLKIYFLNRMPCRGCWGYYYDMLFLLAWIRQALRKLL